mmetsp:Transcript_112620/g.177214  ORF Transcript_112620/g.177214 Transcript_112620/m.177214 type:complete len:83 (+) Transcript_112620:422-670(+)
MIRKRKSPPTMEKTRRRNEQAKKDNEDQQTTTQMRQSSRLVKRVQDLIEELKTLIQILADSGHCFTFSFTLHQCGTSSIRRF